MQRQNEPFNRGPGGIGGPGGRAFGGPRSVMPVVKAKDFRGTLRKLWLHFGSERKSLGIVLLLVLGSSALALIAPYLIGRTIDVISEKSGFKSANLLGIMAAALSASYLLEAVLALLQGWTMAGVSNRIVQNLRRTLFDKLQRLPVSFFDLHTHGELMSRLSNDIENISGTISQATTQLLVSVIMVSGSLVMMLILSPLLTLASVITIPLVFLVTKSVAKRTRVLFKEQQVLLGKLNGHIEETISGIQVIKAFNHEDKVIEDFQEINSSLNKVGIKAQIWSGFIMPLMNVINNIGFAVVAGAGGALAVKGIISVGIIASFLSYSRQFARPLNEIANIFNILQSAVAGAERVFEILEVPEEKKDAEDSYILKEPKGHVIFDDVSFGYRPDVPVLEHVSFEAKAGSTIALVGPTGAGKTTIVNLLARFYEVTSGRILIDDIDIREYTRDSLRRCFGIVLQDTYLFSGTIKDNIRYGKLGAADEEIEKAAIMANADVFIRRLPQGYDTMLAENGSNLSQGQRQLLAIARAILANPSILILDEATSSVDTRTELHIQEAMLKLMEHRTSFIIAHRLSTVRDADIIMVIDKGRIVEQGSHDELVKNRGVYAQMYFSQLRRTEVV
ncbi:MAG: multidrug transporter ATP-binding protein [Clostridia bacterium]|jgi:ATP-binding cassette subfamily B protein|nr:multidrug transporter ATP-binding protein [Clostridia bacterium]